MGSGRKVSFCCLNHLGNSILCGLHNQMITLTKLLLRIFHISGLRTMTSGHQLSYLPKRKPCEDQPVHSQTCAVCGWRLPQPQNQNHTWFKLCTRPGRRGRLAVWRAASFPFTHLRASSEHSGCTQLTPGKETEFTTRACSGHSRIPLASPSR